MSDLKGIMVSIPVDPPDEDKLTLIIGEASIEHDSDCATHNMPAFPNERCNCSSSKEKK